MSRRNAKGFTHSALRFPTLNSPWSPKVFTIAKLKGELPGLFDAAQLDHNGIEDFRATGGLRCVPFFLALKAEALHLVDRTFEALEAIREAEGLVERFEERLWRADVHRLRGVLLTAMGADETQIEASFCEAVRTARQQKSIPLAKRAEASYAEYRSKKGKL